MRNPYVTGSYVTGHRHYGREALLDYLLHGESRASWVVGNRRIGKTSLLRHLETLALQGEQLVPLVWDMQGCGNFACLGRYLADAVQENAERFASLGMTDVLMKEEDVLALLGNLRRLALRAGKELLLLCDETEVLVNIARDEPEAMQRLHRLLTGGAGLRVAITSTRQIYRMHDVCRDWPTSSFLAGFDMSHTLGSLAAPAAQALIRQTQAPEGEQVHVAQESVAAISYATNNHPLLLQLLCSRLFQEDRTLRPVAEEDLRVDRLMGGFFEHDFRQLTAADRRIVLAVHFAGPVEPATLNETTGETISELNQRLYHLEGLGYLRRIAGRVEIGNLLLANWLTTEAELLTEVPASATSEAALRAVFARQEEHDTNSLVSQLNARRGRLIALEAIRAESFLAVTPPVLAEIEQLQVEIGQLRSLLDRRQPPTGREAMP